VVLIAIPKKKFVEPAVQLSAIAQEIDEFGRLSEEAQPILEQIEALQKKLKPLADAKKKLEAAIEALEADDDVEGQVEQGAYFEATVGKRGTKRSIKDLEKVKAFLGTETFMAIASVKLTDIDAYLTPPQKEQCLATARTAHAVKVTKRS
jgi:hypothetical protein